MNGEDGSLKRHSRDSLVYLTTCMIGHLVEAHLKNGSVYSGIFHAADVEKDFGIVLKMASLVKDGTLPGHKSRSQFVRKPPYKTFIIPADELVQVVAKDLSVVSDGKLNAVQSDKSGELLTDSSISKSCRVVQRSERKPRVLDGEAPEGLDNVFDESCRSEEQVLKATPLMVSSQLKVQESTSLVQTVEEKNSPGKESAEASPSSMSSSQLTYTPEEGKEEGIESFLKVATVASREAAIACLTKCKWNQDDAISYFFGDYTKAIQDSPSPVKESAEALSSSMSSILLTNSPEEQLSRLKEEIVKSFCDVVIVASRKDAEACLSHCKWNQEDAIRYFFGDYTEANPEIAWSQAGESQPFQNETNADQSCSIPGDHAGHLPSEQRSKDFPPQDSSTSESQLGERRNNNNPEGARSNRTPEKSVSGSGHGDIKEGGGGTSASKTVAENERQVSQISGETKSESAFGQSDSRRISESGPATPTSTRPGLSPSSPISSLPSSEKSTLNPNAKFEQFKATMNVEDGSLKRRSRDSLVYLTTCMIGHLVEAYLKNGSVYSGIFHAAHVEKDFGIVLKMASLVKDGTLRGHKSRSEFVRKPPYKTFIITGDELVQVVAKDLSVISDGKLKAVQSEKSVELLTDSSISKSCRFDQGRELKHWVPDGQAPEGLDNVFDKPWKRGGWDQFKVNQERFGVMSTFNEEMYTTPLDRGLWTRELEEKAREIAREIEGENTGDLHVAEERGLQVNEKFDTDEEAKYSAVRRVDGFDDSGFDEEDDKLLDTCNDQTFGGSSTSIVQKPASSSGQKPTSSSGKGYGGESCSISDDHAGHLPSEQRSKYFPARGSSISESQLGERRNNNNPEVARSNRTPEKSVSGSGHGDIKEGGGGTSASKTVAENERQVSQISGETKSESAFGQSDSRRISESGPATPTSTRPGLSPSSPISSLPSPEKSTLNPNAKFEQFKATMNVEDGSLKRRSRDSLVYLTTCMIGHLVEAYLKNGSVYSGIFHAAHVEKDFGIVLKMASLVKDGTLRGHKSRSEFVRKPPYKTFIITGDELVQVVAKDLSVFSDGKLKAVQSEKSVELLTDSSISKSCRVDQGRELKHWVPDGQAPEGLDNVFDKPWKRGGWDQFKVNQERFGVMSTFNEEMYTTPLDRGLWTRELEEKAREIAREIEGENTGDLHVAEERGLQVNEKFDTDEEAKYSAVRRVDGFDDSGFDEEDDKLLDTCNDQTFGGSSTSIVQKPASSGGQKPTSSSGKGYGGESCSISDDHAGHLPSEQRSKYFPARGSSISESQLGERRNNNNPEVARSNRSPEVSVSGHGDIEEGANLGGGGTSSASMTVAEKERQVNQVSGERKSESSFGQSASRRGSESGPAPSASTRPGLSSPSSSISSLPSSEKSILNPNAKEFKPSQSPAPVRPQSPIAGGSFYYAAPPPPVQQMPVMPAGYGIQPQYPGQQQLLRYPGHEYPQTYYPPNAPPQYQQWQQLMMQGQELMMQGQYPRPPDMIYMPLPPPYQPGNPHNQG
ncbi:uncharacterized protein LOC106439347 isoform X2 [Brassica napus]|uniref:uncharacterized protein LOC106439347 isoform X2 n=1 Tax=Brassica napus TaxID=3708 RepID=UPI002078C5D3|nr:uncharacterized protein LOC106439347 isoform X2 [Brassica napus]